MKTRILFILIITLGTIFLSSCDSFPGQESTLTPDPASISEQAITPDPSTMNPHERIIWDFEQFRNEIKELSSAADETSAGDLDSISRQMSVVTSRIKKYDFPLEAALAHSVLYNYAFMTTQCYMIKFDMLVNQMPEDEQEFFFGDFDRCERALVYEDTFNMYLKTLKETDASEWADTPLVAQAAQSTADSEPLTTPPPTTIPEHLRTQTQAEYKALIDPIVTIWNEKTGKLNEHLYQSIIEELPRLREEFASLEHNPSFDIYHTRKLRYMDCQIASYLAIIGPEGIEVMNFDSDPLLHFENCSYVIDY